MRLIPAIIILTAALLLTITGCQGASTTPAPSATPIEVPAEARGGETVTVKIKVTSDQPCELILAKSYKTEVDNYFAPYTTRMLAYPDNKSMVTWNQQIPVGTVPGDYILRVRQMTSSRDTRGAEVFSSHFLVK